MVVRHSINCNSCKGNSTLRISIGGSSSQKHIFHCPTCNDELGIILDLDQRNAGYRFNKHINCNPTRTEGTIINLNPDFLIPKEYLHQDKAFPHLQLIEELHKRLENINFEPQIDTEIKTPLERWNELKPIWSFLNNKKYELLRSHLNLSESMPDTLVEIEVYHLISKFFESIYTSLDDTPQSEEFSEIVAVSNKNSTSFPEFTNYVQKKLRTEDIKKLYDLFNYFFDSYTDFSPIHLALKTKLEIKENHQPSSTATNNTKRLYADCFELIGSDVPLLAFIFNMSEGRHFSFFSDKKWAKYKKEHKKFLLDYIRPAPPLIAVEPLLNNRLRNASSHQSMEWDSKKCLFKCDDRGKIFEITYLDYLKLCLQCINYLASITNFKMALVYHKYKDEKPTPVLPPS